MFLERRALKQQGGEQNSRSLFRRRPRILLSLSCYYRRLSCCSSLLSLSLSLSLVFSLLFPLFFSCMLRTRAL